MLESYEEEEQPLLYNTPGNGGSVQYTSDRLYHQQISSTGSIGGQVFRPVKWRFFMLLVVALLNLSSGMVSSLC